MSSDTEDSYDSEEERFVARQQASHRGAALRAEQSTQADLLAAYRARQQQRQQMEEAVLMAKLNEQQRLGGAGWQQGDAGEGWRGPADGRAAMIRVLQQHERQWDAMLLKAEALSEANQSSLSDSNGSSSSHGLAYVDVPWPPMRCTDYLQGLAALEQQRRSQRSDLDHKLQYRRAARRAYAHACRRWHPDKFVARWGALLASDERPAILQRVQEVSQGINEAWEAQQLEWTGNRQG